MTRRISNLDSLSSVVVISGRVINITGYLPKCLQVYPKWDNILK